VEKMAAAAADELVAKAEKKLKGGVFGSMFGNKKEEAIELLQEAGNKYKQVGRAHLCFALHTGCVGIGMPHRASPLARG
jgi:hypothetical protein